MFSLYPFLFFSTLFHLISISLFILKAFTFSYFIDYFISCIITGLIIGAIIRYGFKSNSAILHMSVVPGPHSKYNETVPPDTLWLRFPEDKGGGIMKNKTFAYNFRGEIFKQDNEIDLKVIQFIYKSTIFKDYMKYQSKCNLNYSLFFWNLSLRLYCILTIYFYMFIYDFYKYGIKYF